MHGVRTPEALKDMRAAKDVNMPEVAELHVNGDEHCLVGVPEYKPSPNPKGEACPRVRRDGPSPAGRVHARFVFAAVGRHGPKLAVG